MTEKTARNGKVGRSESRRQQVLDAAALCFRRSGFRGASMSEISAEAGMSTGHIYHYFKSKEALVEAIVTRDIDQGMASIDAIKAHSNVVEALIEESGRCLTDRSNVSHPALSIEILAEASRNPSVAQICSDCEAVVHDRLFEMFELGRQQGGIAPDAPIEELDALLRALYDGITVQKAVNPDYNAEPLRRVLPKIIAFLLHPVTA